MVEEILTVAGTSTYDFRKAAYSGDPLQHLFAEWLPYYRMKWAIARTLKPESILEIGVRFGYSALAFLNAVPSAKYVGIDNDSSVSGGYPGAIRWAKEACSHYQAEFILADSTKMERFPGGRYDLIHIDGQQDGEGTMHDLVLASAQTNYILVDGFFWSRANFFSASYYLYQYRDLIEFFEVIPGYAGELLIKVKELKAPPAEGAVNSSIELRDTYTKDYYLLDCGGYEAFKRTYGKTLEDPRLEAVAELAGAALVSRALDLGCGRGELSLELARRGFEVTAIDYSEDAVAIAREAISRNSELSSAISLLCGDVNSVAIQGQYNVVVAADLIEHMKAAELDRLYQRTSEHLAQEGLFIVHTYPNLWFYRYEHRRRLKIASKMGAFLPAEPRTRYELLMHINEQSPRTLKRQLSKFFPHVLVWFGTPAEPGENLKREFTISEMRASPDLFAVASHQPISKTRLLRQLSMEALAESEVTGVQLAIDSSPESVSPGARFVVSVNLQNHSTRDLKSVGPYPVHLSYHWLDSKSQCVIFDGERTQLIPPLRRDTSAAYKMNVTGPTSPGAYVLRAALVQEGIRWLDRAPDDVYSEVRMLCLADQLPSGL